jgi:hypothetical protein
VDLGEITEVQYMARKIHDQFAPVSYYHQFGEESDGAALPRGMYDKIRKRIYLVGGDYYVDDTNKISPGIEN